MYMLYMRVSSEDQNLERQKIILNEWLQEKGIEDVKGNVRWYEEKKSGASIDGRPVFKSLLEELREDDTLVVISLDRLGRNNAELQNTLYELRKKGATFEILDAPFLSPSQYPKGFGAVIPEMLIPLFGYLAENERVKIKERQAQGIANAKEKGVYNKPRAKRANTEANKALLLRELKKGNNNRAALEKMLGVSRPTLLKMIRELGF